MMHNHTENREVISKSICTAFHFWLVLVSSLVSGCVFGPSMMRANHLTRNDAVQFTERQERLLNIVRLRYTEGLKFLAPVPYRPNSLSICPPPVQKIELKIIYLLINYGWDMDRVLRPISDGINGLRNDTLREEQSEYYAQQLPEFAQTAKNLAKLQQLRLFELSFDAKDISLSGPISADSVELSDILEANKDNYKLVNAHPETIFRH